MPIKIREDGTRVLVIEGTGPEPPSPPYETNKPGIPPGANPPGLKIVERQRRRRRKRR